jgi:hypothetical protein
MEKIIKVLILPMILFLITTSVKAQDSSSTGGQTSSSGGTSKNLPSLTSAPTTISDLDTPSFPAGDILGVSPSAIDKPSSTQQLQASLLSGLSGTGEYGVQVNPYYLSGPIQSKAATQYFQVNGDMFLRNIALSLLKAGINSNGAVTTSNSTGTGIGIGLQSLISFSDQTAAIALQNDVDKQSSLYADLHFARITQDQYNTQMAQLEADAVKQEKIISGENNVFLKIQPACAFEFDFPTNDLNVSNANRFAWWLNADFCPAFDNSNKLDAIFDVRNVYLYQTSYQSSAQYWDLGGRLQFQTGSFAVSYEYVGRVNTTSNRQDGILQYDLDTNSYITGTFGTDFANSSSNTPLIAILGIHFGFGQKPLISNS